MYLLDTGVVSRLRRAHPHSGGVPWPESVGHRLLRLSAESMGEIQAEIELARDQDPGRAAELEQRANEVARTHEVIAMDT
jgi:hypothetical protein